MLFTSTETLGAISDGHLEVHKARVVKRLTVVQVQCCFTSTETVGTVRDGEPRTATSTFTQLLMELGAAKHVDTKRQQGSRPSVLCRSGLRAFLGM